jgi:hypothetical protein
MNINETAFFIINQLTFSFIIFSWYILYRIGFITSVSPLFALLVTFIQYIIIFFILIKRNKIHKNNIIRILFVLFILKIIPLITFFPYYLNFTLADIFATAYLYLIYIIIAIAFIEIFNLDINIGKLIKDDITGDNYEKSYSTKIYDFTYDEIIAKIL